MAYEVITVVVGVVFYLVFSLVRWAYDRHQRQSVFRKRGIPGPKPDFLLGNLRELKQGPTPKDAISKWLEEYGNIFGFFVGEVPVLIVNDVELLKQVMIKDFHNFVDRMKPFLAIKPLNDSVLCLTHERWKEVRSVLTPTFSSSKIKTMTGIMKRKADVMVDVVAGKAEMGEEFDVYELVQALTLDVIAGCALAMKTNCLRDFKDPMLLAVRGFFQHAHNRVVEYAIMFPFLRKVLAFVNHFFTIGEMTSMSVRSVKEAIEFRRKNGELRGNDFLQLLLDASETSDADSANKKRAVKLTDNEIVANAFVFLLAGYETTATALAFTFYLLVKHPDIQEKLHREVADCLKDKELTYDVLNSMQYLDQVFNESLRYYPPVTGFVSRECQTDYKLGDYVIPKGCVVEAPVWSIHHDPNLWRDPWTFDPDRFSPENRKNIHSVAFCPFGIGPRNCVGMRFAQLEAKLALASLIHKFKFVAGEKTEESLTLVCPTVIINPSKGVYLKAVPR